MNSFFNRLKTWLLPLILVIAVIWGLSYLQKQFHLTDIFIGDENQKGQKGFAKALESTAQEKAASDQKALAGALHSGALEDCEKIQYDETLKQSCLDRLNYALILKSETKTGCDRIEDAELKQLCQNKTYLFLASEETNELLCDRIADPALLTKCKDNVAYAVARQTPTEAGCTQLASEENKTKCLDNYYLKESTQTQNPTNCAKLSNQGLQSECRRVVTENQEVAQASQEAEINKKIIRSTFELLELCDTVDDPNQQSICKNTLYPRLAFEQKDLSYCDKITDGELAQSCKKEQEQALNEYYLRRAQAEKDPSVCESITSSDLKALCLKQ